MCRESTAHGFHFKLNIRLKAEVKTSANQSNGHSQIGLSQSDSLVYLSISLQQLNRSQTDSQKLIAGLVSTESCWRGIMNKDAVEKNEEAAGPGGRDGEEGNQQL